MFVVDRGIYGPAFRSVVTKPELELGLRENDYVFGDLKVGGPGASHPPGHAMTTTVTQRVRG